MIIFFTMEVNDDKFQALVIIPKKVKREGETIPFRMVGKCTAESF